MVQTNILAASWLDERQMTVEILTEDALLQLSGQKIQGRLHIYSSGYLNIEFVFSGVMRTPHRGTFVFGYFTAGPVGGRLCMLHAPELDPTAWETGRQQHHPRAMTACDVKRIDELEELLK